MRNVCSDIADCMYTKIMEEQNDTTKVMSTVFVSYANRGVTQSNFLRIYEEECDRKCGTQVEIPC